MGKNIQLQDRILYIETIRFIAEGNLESFPWSFFEVFYSKLRSLSIVDVPRNASQAYYCFKEGLRMLEAEARNPNIKSQWDDDIENKRQKINAQMERYISRDAFLRSIRNRFMNAEKRLVQT